jgi:TP901 family phage tail tape measure protein
MGSSNILIKLVLQGFTKAQAQMNTLGKKTDKSGEKFAKFGKVAGTVAIAVGVALVKGLSSAVQEYAKFNDKMTQSLAIMDTTLEEQQAMESQAMALSRTTRISAEQSAEAYFFLASAGLDAQQSISALPQVAKFAQAGMFDMALATDLATDSQSALGLTVSDAQQNLENLTRVTDVLVKANTLANASVQQFSEALTNKAGASLKVANKGIEEGVAVLSAFADRGVKGAEAGEKLNQLLRDIPRATAKNSEEFKKLNLQMFDSEGNLLNVADLVENLDSVLSPMSDELKASTLDQLGLNRGVADAVKILSGAGNEIRNYQKALEDAGGMTEEVADKQMGSLNAKTDIMRQSFSELGSEIGASVTPFVIDLVEEISAGVQGFTDFIKQVKQTNRELEKSGDKLEFYGFGLTGVEAKQRQIEEQNKKTAQTYQEYARAVTEANEKQEFQNKINRDLAQGMHGLDELSQRQIDNNKELADTVEELSDEEKKLNEERQSKAIPILSRILSATQKINDIKQREIDLETARNKEAEKKIKADKNLEKAIANVQKAEDELQKQKIESKKVTLEEEIAILRQSEAVKRLEEQEEKSLLTQKELELAKKKLKEITLASTGATSDEVSAQRDLDRALEDVTRAEVELEKATTELAEAQKELNEATAKTPENLMEIALAKMELDEAIADQKALSSFTVAIEQMEKLGLGTFSNLYNGFMKMITDARRLTNGGTPPPPTPSTTPPTVDDVIEEIEEESKPLPEKDRRTFTPLGAESLDLGKTGGLVGTSSANNTIITVNTGALLGSEADVQVAVLKAIREAEKKGIKVIT